MRTTTTTDISTVVQSDSASTLLKAKFENRLRPKIVQDPDILKDDFLKWSKALQVPIKQEGSRWPVRDPKYKEFEKTAMAHFPFKEDQLEKVSFLRPNCAHHLKPPLLRFGWIIHEDEIKALARREELEMITTTDYVMPGHPDYPEGQEPDEYGGREVIIDVSYQPLESGEVLLEKVKAEDPDLKQYSCHTSFFTLGYIYHDFSSEDEKSSLWFITIYTTMDLMISPTNRPRPEHIKKVQKWFGLKDREPGWYVCGSAKTWVTWPDYWRFGH
ncbi:hypothetical protein BDY19DRAFT_304268 [Irpex rosettiformis]|uniref:Uncharacterized protein n=1 Tax=Irpex rosettiformis TaxID=378272 RepID=A0ACB8TZ89_9APHY|nr:hypothetical protein BDY19DRAFT_304268 [Irpex rosettiformis]